MQDLELPEGDEYYYSHIPDQVLRPNENASVSASMCTDLKLVMINNLNGRGKTFANKMTSKQGNVWISELDLCVMSCNMTDYVDEFTVHQTDFLPSDRY